MVAIAVARWEPPKCRARALDQSGTLCRISTMVTKPRPTHAKLQVLDVLLRSGAGGAFGAAISRDTGLKSGTLYPLLLRLEDDGWVSSEWEIAEPEDLGRPRRRYYRITALGQEQAASAARSLRTIGGLAWG